jgi:hypothetical protein
MPANERKYIACIVSDIGNCFGFRYSNLELVKNIFTNDVKQNDNQASITKLGTLCAF